MRERLGGDEAVLCKEGAACEERKNNEEKKKKKAVS